MITKGKFIGEKYVVEVDEECPEAIIVYNFKGDFITEFGYGELPIDYQKKKLKDAKEVDNLAKKILDAESNHEFYVLDTQDRDPYYTDEFCGKHDGWDFDGCLDAIIAVATHLLDKIPLSCNNIEQIRVARILNSYNVQKYLEGFNMLVNSHLQGTDFFYKWYTDSYKHLSDKVKERVTKEIIDEPHT